MGAAGTGGTPPPPAGYSDPPLPGAAGGRPAGTFRGRLVVINGTGPSSPLTSGEFVYSTTPGQFGSLIYSVSGQSGFDQFGNAVIGPGAASYNLTSFGWRAAVVTGGAVAMYSAPGAGGPWTLLGLMNAGDGSAFVFNLLPIAAEDPAGPVGKAETWHSLGTLAGYAVGIGRYRLKPTGETEIEISVTAGGANAASVAFSNAVPAAYRPLADRRRPLGLAGGSFGTVPPNLFIAAATGIVTVGQNANNTVTIYGDVTIPLD